MYFVTTQIAPDLLNSYRKDEIHTHSGSSNADMFIVTLSSLKLFQLLCLIDIFSVSHLNCSKQHLLYFESILYMSTLKLNNSQFQQTLASMFSTILLSYIFPFLKSCLVRLFFRTVVVISPTSTLSLVKYPLPQFLHLNVLPPL